MYLVCSVRVHVYVYKSKCMGLKFSYSSSGRILTK
jgi:hypothetical protein